MRKVKSLLNKMSSPMRPPAGLGDLRLIKSFVSKVFSLFITTQSAEDSRQRRSGMTALLDVKAFTLVELLVVVLIIGILSAIAIPMYQGAVDKSHWSTMLPASKAIKDAEEAFKMTNGEYSDTMEHLDVQISNNDLTFTLNTPNNLADPNVIRVTNSKLSNVRLASYLDDNPKFAGQLHCEALKNDERANKLCGKLLMGQELTSQDGYTGYLLDQDIDKATCDNASRSWSTSKTRCYKTTADRCTALGMPALEGKDACGYVNGGGKTIPTEGVCEVQGNVSGHNWNSCNNTTIENGGTCIAREGDGGCWGVTVKAGGVCIGKEGNACGTEGSFALRATYEEGAIAACSGNGYCGGKATFDGGLCIGNGTHSCAGATFTNNAICYANVSGACGEFLDGTGFPKYKNGGCCCGYCPSSSPKCEANRCDPYYMDPNNFKDL